MAGGSGADMLLPQFQPGPMRARGRDQHAPPGHCLAMLGFRRRPFPGRLTPTRPDPPFGAGPSGRSQQCGRPLFLPQAPARPPGAWLPRLRRAAPSGAVASRAKRYVPQAPARPPGAWLRASPRGGRRAAAFSVVSIRTGRLARDVRLHRCVRPSARRPCAALPVLPAATEALPAVAPGSAGSRK